MKNQVRFLSLAVGVLSLGVMEVAGCGSSSTQGTSETIDSGSTSSSTSSVSPDASGSTSTSSSSEVDAGDAGHDSGEESDAGDAGHDSGTDAGHDSGTESDAGDAGHDAGGPESDAGDAGSDAGDAGYVLDCLTITCSSPDDVCCPGGADDGGVICYGDVTTCDNAPGAPSIYECTGQQSCPSGEFCCLQFGASTNGNDIATCMSATDCNAGGAAGNTYVCQDDQSDTSGQCASLGETCAPPSDVTAALWTCE
ncbi:MAG TPA: hypothetical protein VEK07_05685 [Polyangiaceae bacterium]|nr:hypothetical protein [Polyangiaceae bacterium]